jgi:hypothetical protein
LSKRRSHGSNTKCIDPVAESVKEGIVSKQSEIGGKVEVEIFQ